MPSLTMPQPPATPIHWLGRARAAAPGLALAAALASMALPLSAWAGTPLVSPMVLAMVAGIAIRNTVGLSAGLLPGIKVALRPVLRAGIVLLGARLTFGDLGAIGLTGTAVVALALVSTFVFTKAAARVLKVDAKLGELIAAGTSICGASAVLAVNTVTRASDEDVAYAIACVTVFGSLSMVLFPLLAGPLGFTPETYGLWVGASIHEVAQAVGGGFALGDAAGETATVAKLGRVMLLAPLILALGALASRRGGAAAGRTPIPWFVFGFIAVVALNSFVALPDTAVHGATLTSTVFLTMALGAMGLETDITKLRLKGVRPLLLGAVSWVFIAATAAGLVTVL